MTDRVHAPLLPDLAPRRLEVSPRGLRRESAARYVGVSPTKFDEWVRDGRMPTPKRVDGCVIWDRCALDDAFEALPTQPAENEWDSVLKS